MQQDVAEIARTRVAHICVLELKCTKPSIDLREDLSLISMAQRMEIKHKKHKQEEEGAGNLLHVFIVVSVCLYRRETSFCLANQPYGAALYPYRLSLWTIRQVHRYKIQQFV